MHFVGNMYTKTLVGRPVGITIPEEKKKKDEFVSMMNKIVQKYSDLRSIYPKLPNGEVHKIIEQAKEKYGGIDFEYWTDCCAMT